MSSFEAKFQVFSDAKQGNRDYMEDFISVKICEDVETEKCIDRPFAYFAVFDGHGGAEAAKFAEKQLLNEIIRQPGFSSYDDNTVMAAIKEAFLATHRMMVQFVGKFVVICVFCYYSWCVQCRVIKSSFGDIMRNLHPSL